MLNLVNSLHPNNNNIPNPIQTILPPRIKALAPCAKYIIPAIVPAMPHKTKLKSIAHNDTTKEKITAYIAITHPTEGCLMRFFTLSAEGRFSGH